jgi:hypothetical protein
MISSTSKFYGKLGRLQSKENVNDLMTMACERDKKSDVGFRGSSDTRATCMTAWTDCLSAFMPSRAFLTHFACIGVDILDRTVPLVCKVEVL